MSIQNIAFGAKWHFFLILIHVLLYILKRQENILRNNNEKHLLDFEEWFLWEGRITNEKWSTNKIIGTLRVIQTFLD